jgi:tRNA modification GTPase
LSVVFALATPPAQSAICVFRVSGKGCLDAVEKIFNKPVQKHKTFCIRKLLHQGRVVDEVGVITFSGPNSYTGEDAFEVYGHGGLGVMSLIVEALKGVGFEEAAPGEFTKRAFLNDKLSLNEAESVADVIESNNAEDVFLSSQSLAGGFTKKVLEFSKEIDFFRVRVEGEIDFSDEGEDFLDSKLIEDLGLLISNFELFVGACMNKKRLSVKKKVLFIGPVNSGKSSVFNRLLGFERALVSSVPGTTRDLIESEVFYNNMSFSVSDSAGIRETKDLIEARGIDLSISEVSRSDVVVGIFDSCDEDVINKFRKISAEAESVFLAVYNKLDLSKADIKLFDCCVSAKTGEGFDDFKKVLGNAFRDKDIGDYNYLVRERHIDLFNKTISSLKSAEKRLLSNDAMELAAEDLRISRSYIGDVVGVKTSDSLLGDIFNSFCIGK